LLQFYTNRMHRQIYRIVYYITINWLTYIACLKHWIKIKDLVILSRNGRHRYVEIQFKLVHNVENQCKIFPKQNKSKCFNVFVHVLFLSIYMTFRKKNLLVFSWGKLILQKILRKRIISILNSILQNYNLKSNSSRS